MIDNIINDELNMMNNIGKEYDFRMSKQEYQSARSQIKHFIQNDGLLVKKEEFSKFQDYCRMVFEKYLNKEAT